MGQCKRCSGSGHEPPAGLADPSAVARIANPESYRSLQPDLDKYRPAFDGNGLSSRYAGTDVDGVYFYSPIHGLWERRGYVLVQEHKTCAPEEYRRDSGQHIALECLASMSDRLDVVVTFGPADMPQEQSYIRLGSDPAVRRHGHEPETWAHGRWIQHVRRKVPW